MTKLSDRAPATVGGGAARDTAAALPPELFEQIKRIQIRTQRLVTDVMAGEYESAFKGRGMEFEQVREYEPGDDIRHIDWNVTARMSAPFVKEHREERELTVMLLVDHSSSGDFGTVRKTKNEVAAEVAAILAYTAIRNNDRVGLILFSDEVEHFIPPKKGRSHIWRVIREILTFQAARRHTDIETALEFLGRVTPRRVVAFLISDFLDEGFERRLRVGARRHDLTAIRVTDPREIELPPLGLAELEDAETGELVVLDLGAAETETYRKLVRRRREQLDEMLRAAGVGRVDIWTDRSIVEPIVRFFRARER